MIPRWQRLSVCLLLISAGSLCAQTPAFKVIRPSGYTAANAAFSPALLVNGTLYVSGQGSRNPNDFAGQMGQALRNVQAVLRGAGMDFANIVWINIYLADAHNMAAMDDVYWKL